MTRKITSGRALCIVSSIEQSECTYAELKRKLIGGLGSDLTTLGIKLISEFQSTVRSMTSRDAYIHLKSLTDSIGLLTGSKEELLLFIATAVFRASRPLHQRGVMDCREIQSFNDLNKVALTFSASESEKVGRYQSRGQECYKCHIFGHRAFECRSYVPSNSSSVSHSSSNNTQSGSSSLKPLV